MRITLTLDNGPSEVTSAVLDTLARHDVKATFFVLGKNLGTRENRRLVARASAEGHAVGNHTFTHCLIGAMDDPAAAIAEVEDTQRLLEGIGLTERLFRPTGGGGILDERVMLRTVFDHLVAQRYSCVLWNSVPRDWEDPNGWVERALDDVRTRAWTVLVLHDLPTGAMDRLDDFLTAAKGAGATFTQAFPGDCVVTWRGEPVRDIAMVER